jgi:hypothetical protein
MGADLPKDKDIDPRVAFKVCCEAINGNLDYIVPIILPRAGLPLRPPNMQYVL